jgi:hypothetical protein
MREFKIAALLCAMLALASMAPAADNLQINPKLHYNSDSRDGPLITGEHLENGVVEGRVNYVIIYAEDCFNSKRQARRTVELYEKYKDRVNFVIVDLDQPRSPAHEPLIRTYYRGVIPQVVIIDKSGNPAYNQAGEVSSEHMSRILDRLEASATGN